MDDSIQIGLYKLDNGKKVEMYRRFYTSVNKLVNVHKIDTIQEAIKNRGSMNKVLKKKKK